MSNNKNNDEPEWGTPKKKNFFQGRKSDSRPGSKEGNKKSFGFKKDFDGNKNKSFGDQKPKRNSDDTRKKYVFKKEEFKTEDKRISKNKEGFNKGTGRKRISPDQKPQNDRRPSKGFKKGFGKQDNYIRPESYKESDLRDKLPEKVRKNLKSPSEDTRLNKYISNAGICSRREADVLIESGQITVNGNTITEMGYKVQNNDIVKYGKRLLNKEKLVYVLLNKPKDFITTTDDPAERRTVMDLVSNACKERIYPVGRLDRFTTGLLLLTNDGELADKLSHPSNEIRKIYEVQLDKAFSKEDFYKVLEGLQLEDGEIKADELAVISPDATKVGIEIHSGKNRIVRRLFESLGYEVVKLDRTIYAGLTKKDLPRSNWRFLNEKEIIRLKYLI